MVKMKDALLTSQTPARNSSLLHSSLRLCASPLQLLRPRDKQFSPRDWYDTEKRIEENEYSFKNHVYHEKNGHTMFAATSNLRLRICRKCGLFQTLRQTAYLIKKSEEPPDSSPSHNQKSSKIT